MNAPVQRCAVAFAPGRTELAGNHTDHQGGRVISATVDAGISIEIETTSDSRAQVESAGFPPVDIDVADRGPKAEEAHTTAALVRGVAAGLVQAGVPVKGFRARVESGIAPGGGLSSSAAFELALASALVALFGSEAPGPIELARIGVVAEREFFGKPCGWQDQTAIACGGISVIDFAQAEAPVATPLAFDFAAAGHAVALVDTRCDHSLYTDEFAQVVGDMQAVARLFGCERLGEVGETRFFEGFRRVRETLGDRAALRAFHYINEMRLVERRERALQEGDFDAFLAATRASGASSAQYLQNVATLGASDQPAMIALAAVDRALGGRGAFRIHGGGFGGSVQAFVPLDMVSPFTEEVEAILGCGCVTIVGISKEGACARCR